MWEGIGNFLASMGDKINQNPEQFAIGADMIGRNLAPDNPFAGVGTLFGQSSLANKAAEQQMKERKGMMDMLLKTLGGGGAEAPATGGTQPKSKLSLMGDFDLSSLTAPDQPGPTSMTFKAGPDGTITSTQNSTVQPKKSPVGVNLSDIAPF